MLTSGVLITFAWQALSALMMVQRLVSSDVGLMLEHDVPRSWLLRVQDIYAAAVFSAARLNHIDPVTGDFSQADVDVSTNFEFTIIWNQLRRRGYFSGGKDAAEFSKLVVDIGAMYVHFVFFAFKLF